MSDTRWPDGVHLLLNAGPGPHWPRYDIWRTGGPGGPCLESETEEAAHAIIDAIDELHMLRAERTGLIAEVERLRDEVRADRAAVVAWLREVSERRFPRNEREQGIVFRLSHEIERGEYRREGEK